MKDGLNIDVCGDKKHNFHYSNGRLHREDGPAITLSNGSNYWYKNGSFHRNDGPAIEYADGTKEWYLDGIEYTEKEFNSIYLDKKLRSELADKNKNNPKVKV